MIFRFFFLKEARKHPFFFLLLAFTLFLGTFGLTGISLVNYQVQKELSDNAKSLLTSDLSVSARREFSQDEDYGMSVAEAQMTGLPSILTDWGGLASFEHPELPEATRFLSVRIGIKSKVVSSAEAVQAIGLAMKSPRKINREKLIALSRERFSVSAATQILSRILGEASPKFISLSEFHSLISRRQEFGKRTYTTKDLKIHPIYRRIYSAYVRNS